MQDNLTINVSSDQWQTIINNLGQDGVLLIEDLDTLISGNLTAHTATQIRDIVEDIAILEKPAYEFLEGLLGGTRSMIAAYIDQGLFLSYFNAADFLVSPDNGYMIMVSPDAVSILYNELAKDNCKTKQEYLTKLYKLQESGELDFYSAPNSRLFIVPTDQEPFERYRGLSLNKIEDLKEFEFQTGGSLSAYKRIIPKDSHLIQDI